MAISDRLEALVAPAVESLGYEFWGLEYRGGGKHVLLRVYIEHENGITLDDCEAVSKQVSAVLDVEDPIKNAYRLEVSSPGMDRILFRPEHYEAYIGHEITVRLRQAFEGKRSIRGRLVGLEEGDAVIESEGFEYLLPLDSIDLTRVIPQFD